MNHKRTLLIAVFIGVLLTASGFQTSPEYKILFEKAKFTMETKGDLNGAINLFNDIIKKYPKEREYAAKSQLYIGLCYEKLGVKEAQRAYKKVVNSYPEQTETVKLANEKLSLLLRAEAPVGKENNEFSIRRVKEGLDVGVLGAVSPDGRYLSYADEGPLDLAIYEIATGDKRILVKGDISSDAYYSRWSPDGKMVAYTWYQDEQYDLRVVGLEGNKPRVLYRNVSVKWLELEDWSPDGKSILTILSLKDRTYQMVLVSVQDGSVRVLKNFDYLAPGPARLSPDGRYIAYTLQQSRESDENDIFVLALDGGRETPLVQDPANDGVLDWTPDGKGILFRSDRTGTVGVWWIQVIEGQSRGTPELLKPDLGPDFIPLGFTRNGLYYSGVLKEMKDVYISEVDLVTGKLISAPSLATQRFVGSNDSPDWSADGQQLLYLSQRAPGAWGARALCVRSTESGKVHEIFSKLNQLAWVRWSPDGRSLLAAAQYPTGEFGTFRIDVQTGDFEHLMTPHIGWPAAWSRDSKAIFSYRSDSITSRIPIVVRNLETGQEKELYSLTFSDSSYYTTGLALSHDGRQLAFSVSESGSKIINVMPAVGGEAHELLRGDKSPMPFASGTMVWASDGRSLLFVRSTSPGGSKTELWQIPLQGGEPRKLELTADNMRDLSVHPDGRHIAFTAGKPKSEIWVMENFLPKEKTQPNNQLTLKKLEHGVLNTPYARLSPDGRYISYPDWNTGELAIHDMVTDKDRRLTNKGSWASSSDYAEYSLFSPDSKQVAYTWRIWSKNQTELRIIGTDGSQSRVIYKGDDPWPVSWSSNGKYISNRGSGEDQGNTIVIRSLETGKEQLLKPALEIGFGLRWAPDGHSIFVNGTDKAKKEGLFRVDTQTGEANLIVEHHFVGVPGLEVSPAGRKIFCTAVAGSGITNSESAYDVRHFVYDLQSGSEQELTRPGNTPLVPLALSPDGSQLAFIGAGDKAGSSGICVMPSSGGSSKQLVDLGTTGWASRVIAWSPDGNYLIYAVILPKTQNTNLGLTSWELWRVSAQGGEPQRLDLKVDGLLRHLQIHPDGQQIVYYTWRGDTEVWIMENFLPK
jgi:Tol biopolymer transport system component